ncbi:MAG: hypothetical protein AAF799_36710 [Myxococcota bacterium]
MARRAQQLILGLGLSFAWAGLSCKGDPGASEAKPETPADESTPAAESKGGGDETKPAAALPDEGPLPTLRTGAVEPEVLPAVEAEILTQALEKGVEFYELRLPRSWQDADAVARIHIERPKGAVAVLEEVGGDTNLLLRVPASAGPVLDFVGTAFITADREDGRRWLSLPFSAKGSAKDRGTTGLAPRWASALAASLRGEGGPWWVRTPSHPWREFAAGRVAAMAGGATAAGSFDLGGRRPRRTELSELMHTTTAATSMQEALQHDRGLRLRGKPGPATVPLAELSGPGLVEHPWPEMIAALPDHKAGTPEPLAASTPADFWYVRFDDIRVLLKVLDEADTWITPVAHAMEERAEVRDLSGRYQKQLGLRRTGLAKALGHTVVKRLAIVGSDPYLREGSDVTFIFELHNAAIFESELKRHLDGYRGEIPGIVDSTLEHGAHEIAVHRDPAGIVRQHRATVGDLAIVSNSPGAIRAVLDAIDGTAPRLSEDQDLAYMLARDPGAHEGFVFLGDRFIAQVVGPRQKVLAARRQQALAALLTPGYAALLYGWLEGKAPADAEALIASGLLDRDELRHDDGEAIAFEPGGTARSSWGSPAALTPLIDLPAPTTVTEAERDAYATFARGYQNYWRQFIDPVAIRLDLNEDGDEAEAVVDVRVLPLITGTDYGDLEEIVGTQRIEAPAIDDGLQMVWAVGADSKLRRELDQAASVFGGNRDIGLGWLGEWVMLGTLDRLPVIEVMAMLDEDIQRPAPDQDRKQRDLALAKPLGRLPVYAAANVCNPTALIATLAAVRKSLNEIAPGMIQWGEHTKHGDYSIVRVGVDPAFAGEFREFAESIALHYVVAGDVVVLGLDPTVLEVMIDRTSAGQRPKPGAADGPQFVMEARLARERASYTALSWAMQGQANRSQAAARSVAEILLRGEPGITTEAELKARGLALFGAYPVSASGRADFSLGPQGAGDGVHGTSIAPVFPELPVEGSPIAALMSRLVGVNASVAFDREPAPMEPPARSLHTRLRVRLGSE